MRGPPRCDSSGTRARLFPHRDVTHVTRVVDQRRPGPRRSPAGEPASAYGVSQVDSELHRTRSVSTARSIPARPQEHHDRQHVQRGTPARPRGARGGAQAARDVHRLDRHPRADALPVGDHRQRRRRGAGRRRAPDRGHPAPRRLGRGPRRRPRHPDRQGAQDRAARRRGGLHQAARRRQVRRRLVRRHRRPARRRRLGRQRAVGAARRRRRPVAVASRGCRSSAAPRASSRRRPEAAFEPKSGLTRKGKRVAKGKTGTRIRFWPDRQIFTKDAALRLRGAGHPGPADVVHRPRPGAGDPRPARSETPVEEKFRHDGGIAEFAEFLAARRAGHRRPAAAGHRHLHRDRAAARRQGAHDPAGRRARAARRRRAAVGHRLRHRAPLVRQRDRHAQGRHPRQRVRAGGSPRRSTT